MQKMNVEQLSADMGDAIRVEELDRRLEMGIWIFNTHDGTTACCGAGNSSESTPNPDLPNF